MTVASRIMSRAVSEQWDAPYDGINGVTFASMSREALETAASDLARELAVMRRAWHYAAPSMCAGQVRLGDKARPAKREPEAL